MSVSQSKFQGILQFHSECPFLVRHAMKHFIHYSRCIAAVLAPATLISHPSQVPIINLPTDLPATWMQPSNRFQNTLLPSQASDHFGKASVRLEKQRVKASQERKRPTKHENGGERESIICRRQRVHQTQKGCFVWLTSESGYPIAKMCLLSLPPPPPPPPPPLCPHPIL